MSSFVPPKKSAPSIAGGLDRPHADRIRAFEDDPTNPAGLARNVTAPAAVLNLELDLPEDVPPIVELMVDGRLRAPLQTARELLRDRLRKAEILRTGPMWAVLRTLDQGSSQQPAADPNEAREVIVAGTLSEGGLSLIDFIGFLATGSQTGSLTAATGDVSRSVYFSNGDVVWASSTSPIDRLGNFLFQRGKITREQLQLTHRDGERRFGRACVERGFIAAHELPDLVQAQLTEIFDKLIATEQGLWFFSRMPARLLADSQIRMSTQGLLVDALRRLDELQIYRQRIRTADVTVQRVARRDRMVGGPFEGADTGDLLTQVDEHVREGAAHLLKQLPGTATIAELMRILGEGEYWVTRAVYYLLRRGLIEIVPGVETATTQPRPSSISPKEAKEIITIYSLAIREMVDEVARVGKPEELRSAGNSFLKDETTAYAHFLRATSLGPDGTIDEESLIPALQGLRTTPQELSDALSELLFFVLFRATELLGRRRGDDLARRVKLILGLLGNTGTAGGGDEG